jgi:hypothetical protein
MVAASRCVHSREATRFIAFGNFGRQPGYAFPYGGFGTLRSKDSLHRDLAVSNANKIKAQIR